MELKAALDSGEDFDFCAAGIQSDEQTWKNHFGPKDVSALKYEKNIFRYLPTLNPVIIRLEPSGTWAELCRVLAAAVRAGSKTLVSVHTHPPEKIAKTIKSLTQLVIEDANAWGTRVIAMESGRIRLIGASPEHLKSQIYANPALAVWSGEVTTAGRLEILPFVQEQSVSITAHRFGTLLEVAKIND